MTSEAYDTTPPRNQRLAPGTATIREATSPPVTDSASPSVQPRASSSSPTACSIVSSSTPKTRSPSRARTPASSALDRRPRRRRVVALGGDADLQALDARGVERERRGRRTRRARASARRAARPGPTRTRPTCAACGTRWSRCRRSAGAGRGGPPARPCRCISCGHAGHGVDDLVLAAGGRHRADQAGGGSPGLVDDGGALGHVGLAEVVLGHAPTTRLEHRPDPSPMASSRTQVDAHDLGDGLPGDVVLRRAEPAAADDGVRSLERLADAGDHPIVVVADPDRTQAVDAGRGRAGCRSTPSSSRPPSPGAARYRWRRLHSASAGR